MKKAYIITTQPFPNGLAGTNRIQCLGKGFLLNNSKVKVVCIVPTEENANTINLANSGIWKDIEFVYPGKETIKHKNWRLPQFLKSIFLSNLFILKERKQIDFAIMYGNLFLFEIINIFICKFFKIRIYKEESEHPQVYLKKGHFSLREGSTLLYKNIYKAYSGLFLMTEELKNYFIKIGIDKSKILFVPHTVDVEKFENISENPDLYKFPYIAYIGSLKQEKDGIIDLVKAFSLIEKTFSIKLLIAGNGTLEEITSLGDTIKNLNLEDSVKYLGQLPSSEIPELLKNAKILASFRPKSLQAQFGFPTKIVEYLATGIPTVTTVNGDLKLYLKNRINCFIVEDFSIETYASTLVEVLENYEFSREVGNNGKKLVKEYFDPQVNTKKIIDYITRIE